MTLPGLDLNVLRAALLKHTSIEGELHATAITGGRSNLTYKVHDDHSTWVFRRPPTAGLTPSAHDVAREFRVMTALADTDVPVPPAVLLCEDPAVMGAPFTVVGHVEGRALRVQEDLEPISDTDLDRCVNELVRVLAALHTVDPHTVGLDDFGRPGYVQRQVALWYRQWKLIARHESPDVDRLHQQLTALVPPERALSIVHGDYRIDNTLVDIHDAGRIRAVIDWALATLGDSRADLAMTCVYRHPAFNHIMGEPAASTSDRMADADTLANRYALASGDNLAHWPFYLALAYFKLGVIAEGIRHRHDQGATSGAGHASAGDAVPELIAAGLDALGTPSQPGPTTPTRPTPARQEQQ